MPRDKYGMVISASKRDEKKPWNQDYGDDWPEMRERALKRDGYRCRGCGKSVKGTSKRAVHHIIPLSKGGLTKLNNLKTECSDCHDKEHPHLMRRKKKEQPLRPFRPTFFGEPLSSSVKTKTHHAKKSRSLF